jgi:hypothetical protein
MLQRVVRPGVGNLPQLIVPKRFERSNPENLNSQHIQEYVSSHVIGDRSSHRKHDIRNISPESSRIRNQPSEHHSPEISLQNEIEEDLSPIKKTNCCWNCLQQYLINPVVEYCGRLSNKIHLDPPQPIIEQSVEIKNHKEQDFSHYRNVLLDNLSQAGLVKLNCDQAAILEDILLNPDLNPESLTELLRPHGKYEKQCKLKTRIVELPKKLPQTTNTKSVLLISFYPIPRKFNPELSEEQIEDKEYDSIIDPVNILGIEDSEPELTEENILTIKEGVAQLLHRICTNSYQMICTSCNAGVFRSGSGIIFLQILQIHLKAKDGITDQLIMALIIEHYNQSISSKTHPDFRGAANRLLLNAIITEANLWLMKYSITNIPIPIIDSELKAEVIEQTQARLTLKW